MSGRFYPAAREELEAVVRTLLADARRDGAAPAPARGAVVPHAGLAYSGATAARVFARLALPPLIAILAPNHTGVARAPGGASLWEGGAAGAAGAGGGGAFRTPLGDVAVDAPLAAAIRAASPLVGTDRDAHADEHAVEVELPFLQVLRGDARIVPLVLAWDDWERARALGEALARVVAAWPEPVLLLASSDLNHYESAAVSARKDRRALDAVAALDGAELLARCRAERISMCGRAPVAALLAATRVLGAVRAEVVDYRHSGWVSGDDTQVVGYGGVVIP